MKRLAATHAKLAPGERLVTVASAPFRTPRETGPGKVPGPGPADQMGYQKYKSKNKMHATDMAGKTNTVCQYPSKFQRQTS